MDYSLDKLVKAGFRPSNLPPKTFSEKRRHQAHVETVLAENGSRASSVLIARDAERRALEALWRTELMTRPELELTDQMKRLWAEYGLPSQFVRSVLWPWICVGESGGSDATVSITATSFSSLIELDVRRTLPFLGYLNDSEKSRKCLDLLGRFASIYPEIGYTQGMSYIAVRIMMEVNWETSKARRCLERILIQSPTVVCMYSLDLDRIKESVGFILDSMAWENVSDVWKLFRDIKFQPVEWFFLEWGLTMFVKNFSLKISAFVLDVFFLEGDVVLFKAAIAALMLVQDQLLLEGVDVENIRGIMGKIGDYIVDSDVFIKTFHEVVVSEALHRIIDSRVLFIT